MGKKRKRIKTREDKIETSFVEGEISIPDLSNRKICPLLFALLTLCILLVYSPSLNGVLTLDDMKVINSINAIDHIPKFFNFRSVSYITLYFNKSIANLSAFNLRFTNILIHIANSVLVYFLVIISTSFMASSKGIIMEDRYRYLSAWMSSFIFALHPLNINAVAYIVQRMASLATLFVLLSLLFYIKASTSGERVRGWLFYSLSGLSLIIGIFSKENAVTGIPLILLYDYIFLSRLNMRVFLKRVIPIIAGGFIILIIASFSLRFHKTVSEIGSIFLNLNKPLTHMPWMTTDVSWTPLQHILTEFRVISRYILLIILPLPRFMIFDGWGYPLSSNLSTPPTTFLAVLFIIGILAISIIKRRRYPFLFFGVSWYLTAISLESFLAVGSDLYFEHRNYLPLSGFFVGVVTQSVISLKSTLQRRGKAFLSIVCILILLLSISTFKRNLLWKDFLGLWTDTVEKLPSNTRAMVTVGKNYFLSSKYEKARDYLESALEQALRNKQSYFYQESALFLGEIYLIEGRFKEAEDLIKVFHRRVPSSHKLMILKGLYLFQQNRLKESVAFLNRAAEEIERGNKRKDLLLYIGLADIYRITGMQREAEDTYKNIIRDYPSNSLSYYGLAMLYLEEGKLDLAEKEIDKLLSIVPNDVIALSTKGQLIMMKERKVDEATSYIQKAMSLSNSFYEPYLNMGMVLICKGKEKEAEEFFKNATSLYRPAPDYMINLSKGMGYTLRGDASNAREYFQKVIDDTNAPQGVKLTIRNTFT